MNEFLVYKTKNGRIKAAQNGINLPLGWKRWMLVTAKDQETAMAKAIKSWL